MCSLLSERKISGADICIALLGSEVRGKSVANYLERKKIVERKVKTCIVVYFFFYFLCNLYTFVYLFFFYTSDKNALQL